MAAPASSSSSSSSGEAPGLTEPARDALRRLRHALGCSRWCGDQNWTQQGHNLLEKPVNLGNCEHVFCLACVGDCVGTACPVCHIPSMVQDVKVSRQLDNIARLYRKLQKLQDGDIPGSGVEASPPWEAVADRGTSRQIKMWFSPRSGKMRFQHLRKRPEKPELAVVDPESQPPAPTTSAYDFPSPSQEPFKEAKKSQLKHKRTPRRRT